MTTVVIQSFHPLPWPKPITSCINSVKQWSQMNGYRYIFTGDEIADLLPVEYRKKCFGRWPMMTDLARLLLAKKYLIEGASKVVWVDADVLIFAPTLFSLGNFNGLAVGREIWVSSAGTNKWKKRRHVHNAVLAFLPETPTLDFLIYATTRIGERINQPASPQLTGPKLLSTLHNLVEFPVLEGAGMLSPWVMADLINGGGPALALHLASIEKPMTSVNLCHSMIGQTINGNRFDHNFLMLVVGVLKNKFRLKGLMPTLRK